MSYNIAIEIAGPLAMWSRPDTGSTPTSYPIPTWSATKATFESIAFFSDGKAWINPTKVEICKPLNSPTVGELRLQKYTTNYRGPLKEKGKSNFQFSALVLSDVCYRLYATIENGSGKPLRKGDNPCHHLQDKFNKRLKNGRCHRTPCLGWSEFTPSYWGQFRTQESDYSEKTELDTSIELDLVSILHQVFDAPTNGQYNPSFRQGKAAKISGGVFNYA